MWFHKAPKPLSRYGWKRDIPDHRDCLYSVGMPEAIVLPTKIDLRSDCSSVENQGELGACTAHAIAGHLEFLETNWGTKGYLTVSRLFIYYNERLLEHTVNYDSGASLRDGIKTLVKTGYCWEAMWPYIINKFTTKPSRQCYENALQHKIVSYRSLRARRELMTCLAEGYPFVFGISVYESFESNVVAKTGVVPMPKSDEKLLGGHAVLCVGYDQLNQTFLVRNSWGANWGMKGYFTLPFEYVDALADDFWTIRK